MKGLIRTSVFGQLARLVSNNSIFNYPDEVDGELWKVFLEQGDAAVLSTKEKENNNERGHIPASGYESTPIRENFETTIVGWYGTDDPENPQNWPTSWKVFTLAQLFVLNFAVYVASSIYVPGEAGVMEQFGVSITVATLGLSLFTVGYGLGPMLWSPLSEIPWIGRSSIFVWTLLVFTLLQFPVGFAPNIATFLVFRAITGFFGSPCLATGGGVIVDLYAHDPVKVLSNICVYSSFGVLGPVLGPIIGAYVAPARGWSWTIWVFTWLCGFVFIIMFFMFPETTTANILHNRAKRLRKHTQNPRFRSQSEMDSVNHKVRDRLIVLARAFTLTFFEPIVFLMDLYTGLLYGVLFIWFESFPLVFGDIYEFSIGSQGLVFIGIFVGSFITAPLMILWIRKSVGPVLTASSFKPEMLLPPAFVGCVAFPFCLFWYGWTARESVHWIIPIIGTSFFGIGIVTLFNTVFNYLAISYPSETASIFAGNALFRAAFGASFPLFARAFFHRLGIGAGNSLLGGIAACFIPVTFIFYRYGVKIRHWSKNARHDV